MNNSNRLVVIQFELLTHWKRLATDHRHGKQKVLATHHKWVNENIKKNSFSGHHKCVRMYMVCIARNQGHR